MWPLARVFDSPWSEKPGVPARCVHLLGRATVTAQRGPLPGFSIEKHLAPITDRGRSLRKRGRCGADPAGPLGLEKWRGHSASYRLGTSTDRQNA